MLDLDYMKRILETVGESQYQGVETNRLVETVIGQEVEEDDFYKFKYHMDEMWEAGLIKGRDGPGKNGWGYQGRPPRVLLLPVALVLTPVGKDFLEELNKPKGLERLRAALRRVGGTAGTEALKFAAQELLRSAS